MTIATEYSLSLSADVAMARTSKSNVYMLGSILWEKCLPKALSAMSVAPVSSSCREISLQIS